MKMKISLFAVLCIIISIACFTSCSNKNSIYYSDIELLKKGPYYLEFNFNGNYGIQSGVLAKDDEKYYLFVDNTVLLLTSDESYVIDQKSKTYCKYNSVELTYDFFDTLLNLKYQKKSDTDFGYIITCRNSTGKSVQLVYENDELNTIKVEFIKNTEYSKFEIIDFTSEIPDSIYFNIPQEYKYKKMYNSLN